MKRSYSIVIALAVVLVSLGLSVLLWPGQPAAPAPSAAVSPGGEEEVVKVTAQPSPSPAPTGQTLPETSPAPTPDGEEPPEGKETPAATETAFDPPDKSPGAADGGEAGTVAGPEYDYSQPVPETEAVGEDYFADAVFIGDSRTDGFRIFSGLSQGDFLVKTGLSVFKVEKEQIKVDGRKMTVLDALGRKTYGKIYTCMGINELGMYDDKGYYSHYAAFLDAVRGVQPQAAVYVQLLIPVNQQKCQEKGVGSYINNEQIAVYNALLRQLAAEKQVFLLEPAQAIVDETTGEPAYDEVADGVHFQKEPYQRWLDYLKRHTAKKGEWEWERE